MELTVTSTIWIDIDDILDCLERDFDNDEEYLENCVEAWIGGLDDCDYYLIGEQEMRQIVAEVKKQIIERGQGIGI